MNWLKTSLSTVLILHFMTMSSMISELLHAYRRKERV